MSSTQHPPLNSEPEPEYVDTVGASRLTGLSTRALDTLRHRSHGPRYLRVGKRIRYRINDLRKWMEREAVPASASAGNRTNDQGGNHG